MNDATPHTPASAAASSPNARRFWTEQVPLVVASLGAVGAFAWPLFTTARIDDGDLAAPAIAVALVPVLAVLTALLLDRHLRSAQTIALLGVLAAVAAAVRIGGTGVGGLEAVFIVLILAGYALGARFGFVLGMLTILGSGIIMGGIGPWTAFQMFAAGWVAAGAGLLPRLTHLTGATRSVGETALLIGYGIASSYLFGALMNLWFWPFAVGTSTSIGYVPGGALAVNLEHFAVYTLLTSTLTWDTVRAITTTLGIALVGPMILAALSRARITVRR